MKVEGWISTPYVRSTYKFVVEIADEDLEGLDEDERNKAIDEQVSQEMWNHAEWGWKQL